MKSVQVGSGGGELEVGLMARGLHHPCKHMLRFCGGIAWTLPGVHSRRIARCLLLRSFNFLCCGKMRKQG